MWLCSSLDDTVIEDAEGNVVEWKDAGIIGLYITKEQDNWISLSHWGMFPL